MAYAEVTDLTARYDIRDIADLSTDDGEPQDHDNLQSNAMILAALADASAEIDAALLAGGRYTTEQLDDLPARSKQYLISIVCSLAMAALFERRGEAFDKDRIERMTKRGREAIDSLRKGQNILGLPEVIDAGRVMTTGPKAIDIENRNDLTQRMSRYFPGAAQRLPRGQQ
jgi:phage gp36-like protein